MRSPCVRYNPKWKGVTPETSTPEAFGLDARDLFIHAIIDGFGGTCGSLPVLYVAIGRRLGYPLKLVKAARHLFVRWENPDGKDWHHSDRFNIEATGLGVHFLPDEHYRTWPHAISEDDHQSGVFLTSLSPSEELAEFLATRGYCLQSNGRLGEAIDALAEASLLSPNNRHFADSHKKLRMYLAMRDRGHAYLNASLQPHDDKPIEPFWMEGLGGHKVLVQIVSQVPRPCIHQPNVGISLTRGRLRSPNGYQVEVWLPSHSSGSQMTAHWLSLSGGRLALVHKVTTNSLPRFQSPTNQVARVGPESMQGANPRVDQSQPSSCPIAGSTAMPMHEQTYLTSRIQMTIERSTLDSHLDRRPAIQRMAIPAGPEPKVLSTSASTGFKLVAD